MSNTVDRCKGCGRPLETGNQVYLIVEGVLTEHSFEEKAEFGYLHLECFRRVAESPQSVMEELHRISQSVDSSS